MKMRAALITVSDTPRMPPVPPSRYKDLIYLEDLLHLDPHLLVKHYTIYTTHNHILRCYLHRSTLMLFFLIWQVFYAI
jgi:hypothetical protein